MFGKRSSILSPPPSSFFVACSGGRPARPSVRPHRLRSRYALVLSRRTPLIKEPGIAALLGSSFCPSLNGFKNQRLPEFVSLWISGSYKQSTATVLAARCTPYVLPLPIHLIPAGRHDLSSNLHFTASLNTRCKVSKTPPRTHKIVLRLHNSKN